MAKKKAATKKTVAAETVLVLRTCAADGSTHNGFKYPDSGLVEAPDWKPTAECGNGLHGWLWGSGEWSLKNKAANIKWLVIEVGKDSIIDLGGKVKFPKGNIIATFTHWADAMKFIRARIPAEKLEKVATGDSGHASATGYYGWAASGYAGQAKANKNGLVSILWFDDKSKRPRLAVGYVGEDGIKADTWYRCDEKGKLVEHSRSSSESGREVGSERLLSTRLYSCL